MPPIPGTYFVRRHGETIEALVQRAWGLVNGHRLIILVFNAHLSAQGDVYHRSKIHKLKLRGGRQERQRIISAKEAQEAIPQIEADNRFASQLGDWSGIIVPKHAPDD